MTKIIEQGVRSDKARNASAGGDDQRQVIRVQRILVPVDLSEASLKALKYASAFAQQCGAALFLVNVLEPPVYVAELGPAALPLADEAAVQGARRSLASLAKAEVSPRTCFHSHVEVGCPWRRICDLARTHEADLIIVATHGYTGLKHTLLGSTAEQIVRHAPCPVLVVREREHDFIEP